MYRPTEQQTVNTVSTYQFSSGQLARPTVTNLLIGLPEKEFFALLVGLYSYKPQTKNSFSGRSIALSRLNVGHTNCTDET